MIALETPSPCYGVTKRSAASNDGELCLEELRRNGCAALPGVFSADEMNQARSKIDQLYAIQAEETCGASTLGRDEGIMRCPLAYEPFFLRIATHHRVLSVIRAILGDAFVLLMQNAIINHADRPQYQVRWHRDLLYQHWTRARSHWH